MDDSAEDKAALTRVKNELADFVMNKLSVAIASDELPELSEKFAAIIKNSIDAAIAERVGSIPLPDGDAVAANIVEKVRIGTDEIVANALQRLPVPANSRDADDGTRFRRSTTRALEYLSVWGVGFIAGALLVSVLAWRGGTTTPEPATNEVGLTNVTLEGDNNSVVPENAADAMNVTGDVAE